MRHPQQGRGVAALARRRCGLALRGGLEALILARRRLAAGQPSRHPERREEHGAGDQPARD
jgi:hypothetical protein